MKRRLKILDVDSGRLTDHPLDPGPRIGRAVLTWWGDKVAVAHSLGGSGSVLTIDVVDGSKTRIDLNGLRVRELCGSGECLLALATNNQSVAPALYHWRKGSWSRLLEAPHADLTRRLESAPSAHVWSLTRVRESPPDSASKTGPAQDAKKRHLIKSWFALGGLMREIAQAATLDESPYVELVSRINQAVTDGDSWAVERMADLLSPLSALWVDPVNPGTPGAWQDVAQRLKSFVEADTTHVAMSGRLAVRFRELDPNLTQAQAEKMAERALGATEDVDWLSETDLVPRLAITIAHIDRRLQRIDGVKFE
jgi:hypothetical protein